METKSIFVRLLVVAVVAVMGLAAVSMVVPAALAMPGHHASPANGLSQFHIAKSKPPAGKSYEFSNSYISDLVASYGADAFIVNALDNGSLQLVVWDSSTNVSTVVQAWVPMGSYAYPLSVVAAGNFFFFNWENYTNGYTLWEMVSVSTFAVTNATSFIPTHSVGTNYLWTFVYGSKKDVYLTDEEGGYLVELKVPVTPGSLTLAANLSAALPAGFYISGVLPEGKLLYVAGEVIESAPYCNGIYNCGSYGLFGVISSKTVKKVTTYTLTVIGNTGTTTEPANLSAGFESLAYIKPYVYVSGFLSIENTNPATYLLELVGAYFFSYDTASPFTWTNLTSHYTAMGGAAATWGIPAIEPFGKNIMLSASWYYDTCPFGPAPGCIYFGEPGYFTGAFYEWNPATSTMTNVTSYFPANYISGAFFVTAESSGTFFTGGADSVTGYGEICSLKT